MIVYWFFLHSVAESYPTTPNATTKRKYYDLIQNFPLFIPIQEMGNKFSELIDKYPVSPYLDTRDSFVRWVHFIHNKLNHLLGKEEISFLMSLEKYRNEYKPKTIFLSDKLKIRKQYILSALILSSLFFIFIYYDK